MQNQRMTKRQLLDDIEFLKQRQKELMNTQQHTNYYKKRRNKRNIIKRSKKKGETLHKGEPIVNVIKLKESSSSRRYLPVQKSPYNNNSLSPSQLLQTQISKNNPHPFVNKENDSDPLGVREYLEKQSKVNQYKKLHQQQKVNNANTIRIRIKTPTQVRKKSPRIKKPIFLDKPLNKTAIKNKHRLKTKKIIHKKRRLVSPMFLKKYHHHYQKPFVHIPSSDQHHHKHSDQNHDHTNKNYERKEEKYKVCQNNIIRNTTHTFPTKKRKKQHVKTKKRLQFKNIQLVDTNDIDSNYLIDYISLKKLLHTLEKHSLIHLLVKENIVEWNTKAPKDILIDLFLTTQLNKMNVKRSMK